MEDGFNAQTCDVNGISGATSSACSQPWRLLLLLQVDSEAECTQHRQ